MLRFLVEDQQVNEYENLIEEVESKASPFKEILGKEDFSYFSVAINDHLVSLESSFRLQVNVKNIGIFHFIFDKDGFNKDEIVNQVFELRKIEVNNQTSAEEKVNALFNIVERQSLLFLVYEESSFSFLDINFLRHSVIRGIQIFVVKNTNEKKVYELNIGEQKQQKEVAAKKQKKERVHSEKHLLKQISDKKFHFLLLIVSTTLFEVSIPLAIVNIYTSNAIYIFLFICAMVGIGMDGYSYYDLFKKYSPASFLGLFSYLSNLIGIGAGVGLFALFYNLSNLEEGVPPLTNMILIGLLVCIIVCGAIIGVTALLPKGNKQQNSED